MAVVSVYIFRTVYTFAACIRIGIVHLRARPSLNSTKSSATYAPFIMTSLLLLSSRKLNNKDVVHWLNRNKATMKINIHCQTCT